MADTVFVYTMNQLGAAGSWSRYVFPWDISFFAHMANDMFVRHGDQVSIVVDSAIVDEVVGDAESAFESVASPTEPSGTLSAIAVSENLMAVGSDTSPYLTIYDRSNDTFTATDAPTTLPAGQVYGVTISPDEQYVAVAMASSPYVSVFKVDRYGDWNKLSNPASLPADLCYGVAWSDDGQHLAVVGAGSPYVDVYKLTADVLTKLTALPGTGGGTAVSVAYSGSDLAVGYVASPYLKVWKRAGDTYSAVTINGTNPVGDVSYIAWSPEFLAASSASGLVYLFERTGTTLTRTTIDEPNVGAIVTGLSFSESGDVLAIGKFTQEGENYYSLWTYDGSDFSEVDVSALDDLSAYAVEVSFGGNYIGILGEGEIGVVKWNGAAEIVEQEYEGIIQWPWLDIGTPGINKTLEGFDLAGTGTARVQIGYDQSTLSTFTAEYSMEADNVPGMIIPLPLTAPSMSMKITYDGGQSWLWNSSSLYLKDGRVTK